jgi:hypothetical protein
VRGLPDQVGEVRGEPVTRLILVTAVTGERQAPAEGEVHSGLRVLLGSGRQGHPSSGTIMKSGINHARPE